MQLAPFLRAQLARGAQLAQHSLSRASARTASALSAAAAYRRAYAISRDFRALLS
jgi:hypothetical protein